MSNPIKVYEAQKTGNEYLDECCRRVQVGMKSGDILDIVTSLEKEFGVEKHWHKPQIRVGVNSMLGFGRSSGDDPKLTDDDIFFIDLGVVIDGVESDQATTVSIGSTFDRLASSSKDLWNYLFDYWGNNQTVVSGKKLYEVAAQKSIDLGLYLDLSEGGHKIGPFPHERSIPNDLKYLTSSIGNGEWVLEVKLIDLDSGYGSFYENALVKV